MTTTIKVHVNGDYEATVIQTVEGEDGPRQPLKISHGEEKQLHFVHDKQNTFEITEKHVGPKKASDDEAGDDDEQDEDDVA